MYDLNCFFIYSILGFIFETVISRMKGTRFQSGILFGPWTPVYGIGVIFILMVSRFCFQNLYLDGWREIGIVFLVLMVVLTFIEWLGGILIEKFFHVTFWNYEDYKFHIGKYIAMEITFAWGILSLILIYGIHPMLMDFILGIPIGITYLFVILFFIDFICTVLKYKFNFFQHN